MRVEAPISAGPWYRRWWRMTLNAVRGVTRLQDTPYRIGVGVGAGLFSAILPILGQTFVGLLLTRLLRGNLVACLPWTWISNPVTSPFIFYGSYRVGAWCFPNHEVLSWERLSGMMEQFEGMGAWDAITHAAEVFAEALIPLAVGSMLVGIPVGLMGFFLARSAVSAIQARRLRR